MGLTAFVGHECGCETEMAFLYCNTSGMAFGPAFECADDVDAFVAWNAANGGSDPRGLSDDVLLERIDVWRSSAREVAHMDRLKTACRRAAAEHLPDTIARELANAFTSLVLLDAVTDRQDALGCAFAVVQNRRRAREVYGWPEVSDDTRDAIVAALVAEWVVEMKRRRM